MEGGDTLVYVVHKCGTCSIPRNVLGQARQGFEQPHLVEGVSAHWKNTGTR